MKVIPILQIISILYFLFALRMRMWRISINSFVVITSVFVIAVSYESGIFKCVWANYHLSIVALMLTFIMARVTYQSAFTKKHRRVGGRRADDGCED
ncbi:MAG: hypothetical protein Q7T77_04895 [Sulfuricurvum sp.]|nr:hypothetical protein [Sulfuricurvum sp.]